jgi:hypothetical protein
MKIDESIQLSHDYVFNYVFKKLSDTFEKYRGILPDIDALEQAITSIAPEKAEDVFEITVHILQMLKSHAEKSKLISEIYENVRNDFWHILKPSKIPKHKGKYYIDSVAE